MLPKQLKDSQRHQRQSKQVELFLQSTYVKDYLLVSSVHHLFVHVYLFIEFMISHLSICLSIYLYIKERVVYGYLVNLRKKLM